jgi:dTDP-4-dehydrorhamnose reductase
MNIIVTGALGQLGTELRNLSAGSSDNYVFTDIAERPAEGVCVLDITDAGAVEQFIARTKADVIVNCAAYTNVDKAEDDPSGADLLNRAAVGNLARCAASAGAVLIHISTDYVFGGDARVPYKEDDAKNPLGVYGRTKLAGEAELAESGCKAIVIRTAWLYSPYGKNFVKTMSTLMASRESVGVVADQTGSPTYAADLAAAIVKIIKDRMLSRTGVYHYSDEGIVSWFDFAREIARLEGSSCKVLPLRSSEFPSKVARPHYSVLDKSKIVETFGVEVPYWKDSLAQCIKRLK